MKEIEIFLGINVLLLSSILGALIDNALKCRKLIKEIEENSFYDR